MFLQVEYCKLYRTQVSHSFPFLIPENNFIWSSTGSKKNHTDQRTQTSFQLLNSGSIAHWLIISQHLQSSSQIQAVKCSCLGKMYIWEVAPWEISHLGSCHLGKCHLGSCPWENAFGKVPNTFSLGPLN